MRTFAAIRTRGPAWDESKPMERQAEWDAHARFMEGLANEGFLVLVGPLEGTRDVLLVIRAESAAEIERRLGEDPWVRNGLLVLKQVAPWQIRLGSLPS